MNKQTRSNIYAMPLPKEIFNALGQAKVFSNLDLRFNYHQLPLKEVDKRGKCIVWWLIFCK
jgi:hypothetical protein